MDEGSTELDLVILTASAKKSKLGRDGDCVSGINLKNKQFVRLVSDEEGDSIIKGNLSYQGMKINFLDIITVSGHYFPLEIQKENFVLRKIRNYSGRQASIEDILSYLPYVDNGNLLEDVEDNVSIEKAQKFAGSLMLIVAEDIKIYKICSNKSEENKKVKTKIDFIYDDNEYKEYYVTDRDYFSFSDECLNYKRALLVISTSDKPYVNNRYYKFVAKIFPLSTELVDINIGEEVFSEHFGVGHIQSIDGETITVKFTSGIKKICKDYLEKRLY